MKLSDPSSSIQLPIAPCIGELAERLKAIGDEIGAVEANRLAEAVSFLETEISNHRKAELAAAALRGNYLVIAVEGAGLPKQRYPFHIHREAVRVHH